MKNYEWRTAILDKVSKTISKQSISVWSSSPILGENLQEEANFFSWNWISMRNICHVSPMSLRNWYWEGSELAVCVFKTKRFELGPELSKKHPWTLLNLMFWHTLTHCTQVKKAIYLYANKSPWPLTEEGKGVGS